jgi:hypothetical protein
LSTELCARAVELAARPPNSANTATVQEKRVDVRVVWVMAGRLTTNELSGARRSCGKKNDAVAQPG